MDFVLDSELEKYVYSQYVFTKLEQDRSMFAFFIDCKEIFNKMRYEKFILHL